MKKNPIRMTGAALTLAVLAGWLAFGGATSPGQAPAARPATAWEYKTFFAHPRQDDDALNRLGTDGWELVAISPDSPGIVRYTFKRSKAR